MRNLVYSVAPACPRCTETATCMVAQSPVAGAWSMALCPTCFYSWRSTEPDYAVKREAMSKDFQIDRAAIPKGKVMPEIPPLRLTDVNPSA
jgi:hypothetical protein